MIQPLDWSATAAWTALIVSIVGTVLGPIIHSCIDNRHQLKMYKMKLKAEEQSNKISLIQDCISGIGRMLSNPSNENLAKFGETFHSCYPYIQQEYHGNFDHFYDLVIHYKYDEAKTYSSTIFFILNDLLTKQLQ